MYQLFKKDSENLVIVIRSILKHFNCSHTSLYVKKILSEHLQYPSLLSIVDCLDEYNIKSVAIRKNSYHYSDFELPFVCLIQQQNWSSPAFTVVSSVDGGEMTYLDPEKKCFKQTSVKDFDKIDKNIILLLDGEDAKEETQYKKNRTKQYINLVSRLSPILFLLVSFVLCFWSPLNASFSWIYYLSFFTSYIGSVFTFFLLKYKIDESDPFLKEVCNSFSQKSNCDSVLKSKGEKFLGISWSILGWSYFLSLLCLQLMDKNNNSFHYFWAYISCIVSPYILYSIFYQAKVVKSWCPICLGVQALIVINLFGGMYLITTSKMTSVSSFYTIASFVFLYVFFVVMTCQILPLFIKAKNALKAEKELKKIKYNQNVFDSLLNNGEIIPSVPTDLGIIIGNPLASLEIIKVCNPYCDPCSKANPELNALLRKHKNLKIRTVFTATGDANDKKTNPVGHFIALNDSFGQSVVKEALNFWYSSDKDYDAFSQRFPVEKNSQILNRKMHDMRKWCDEAKIRVTPTFFINGKELPEDYSLSDLKYFF